MVTLLVVIGNIGIDLIKGELMATITGNPYVHLVDTVRSIIRAMAEEGHTDMTGEPGSISCVDAGVPTGDIEENGVKVFCSYRHGLYAGDNIKIVNTELYDGIHEIEPIDELAFYLLSVPFVEDKSGAWEPVN